MKILLSATAVMALDLAQTGASLAAPEGSGDARLQTFVENTRCYASLPRHTHKADFRIVSVKDKQYREKYSWIMDGDQKIGLVNMAFGEIELFRFFPPEGGKLVEYKMPEVYHWATIRGVRICIVPQGQDFVRGEMAYPQDKGEILRMCYTETTEDSMKMAHEFDLRFDPVLGYILDCSFDLSMEKPVAFEYANILAGHLSESREELKRFQKCIWARRDGAFCYMYQNPCSMMQHCGPEWTDAPAGGFVGWVAELDMNPFLEILRATPTMFVTCSQWYDQHVIGKAPKEKSEDGVYRITAVYRMISLPMSVAKELEDAARIMLPTDRRAGPLGFRQGVMNDFETTVPAGTLYNGCIWGHSAAHDNTTGRSGTHSIRVNGGGIAEPIHGGAAIFVETAKRYRFSAWVRTSGVTGKGVCIRVNEVFWNWTDVRATHSSKRLKGDNDWTQLSLEFTPVPGDPFAAPGLVVDGRGTAWFDDIELVEVPQK